MAIDDITRVAVVGAGLMGHGIALEFALAGYQVSLHDISEERLDLALRRIQEHLQALVTLERATPAQAAVAPTMLQTSTVLGDAVAQADVVIEAVAEDLALKQ
jgi:3-hydroxyacyl-CoA dehydrogenase